MKVTDVIPTAGGPQAADGYGWTGPSRIHRRPLLEVIHTLLHGGTTANEHGRPVLPWTKWKVWVGV